MSAVVDTPTGAKPPAGASSVTPPNNTAAPAGASTDAVAGSTTAAPGGEKQAGNGDGPVPMKIEDVRSTVKAQRIAAHSHINGLGLNANGELDEKFCFRLEQLPMWVLTFWSCAFQEPRR